MKLRSLSIWFLAMLAGCASAPDTYYTLMPESAMRADTASTQGIERVIVVGPVTIPASLDQANMVISKGGHRIDVRESERWAGPLKEEFTSALAARLGLLVHNAAVVPYRQSAGTEPWVRIAVDVSRLDLGPGKQATLDALWVIKSSGKDSAEQRGRTQVTVPASSENFDDLAKAQGAALNRLAQALAAELKRSTH